jgi:hypothetical protein
MAKYLWINWISTLTTPCFYAEEEPGPDTVATFPLSDDGYNLVHQWKGTPSHSDGLLSAVIADWLEDNRSDLLNGAIGRTPELLLDRLIDHLRAKLSSPYHTQS